MKLITYFCVLYLMLLGAPYWAGNGGDPAEALRSPADPG